MSRLPGAGYHKCNPWCCRDITQGKDEAFTLYTGVPVHEALAWRTFPTSWLKTLLTFTRNKAVTSQWNLCFSEPELEAASRLHQQEEHSDAAGALIEMSGANSNTLMSCVSTEPGSHRTRSWADKLLFKENVRNSCPEGPLPPSSPEHTACVLCQRMPSWAGPVSPEETWSQVCKFVSPGIGSPLLPVPQQLPQG